MHADWKTNLLSAERMCVCACCHWPCLHVHCRYWCFVCHVLWHTVFHLFHMLWHGSDNSGLMASSSSSTSSEATRVADYTEKRLLRVSVHVVSFLKSRVCACLCMSFACLCMSVFKGCCACHECFWEGFRFSMTSSSLHFDKRTLSSWFWWWLSLTILINFKMLP